MVFGNSRVSTKGQARGGNSLEAQADTLKDAGCEYIYTDVLTGTRQGRPEFEKLRSKIRKGDTLAVTKLDRIGISVS